MPGLGDVAYQVNGGVQVVQGDHAVSIVVFDNGAYAAPGNGGAVSLARLVLGRL